MQMQNDSSIRAHIRLVRECPSAEHLSQAIHELIKQCEFDYYQFNLFLPSGLLQSHVSVFSHSPSNWLENYWQNHQWLMTPSATDVVMAKPAHCME